MGMQTGNDAGLQSEINVTPLVDVVLVLLIIFMVIVPLTLRGYDVAIPGESVAQPPPDAAPAEQIVLTIDLDGCPLTAPPVGDGLPDDCRVEVNDDVLTVAQLAPHLADRYAGCGADDRVLFLAVHDRVNYEAAMRIVDAAKSATPDLRIGLVTP